MTVGLNLPVNFSFRQSNASFKVGLIADPHKDIVFDADERLATFMEACDQEKPDFILQMGDFCFPKAKNKAFLHLYTALPGPCYHILGNHDMDVSSKDKTVDFWGAEKAYYSFDHKGIHFVVLDANFLYQDGKFIPYEEANFYVDRSLRTYIDPIQIEWLKEDLETTPFPTLVFSHQSLSHDVWGIKNRLAIQKIMEEENARSGFSKIVACFNGHNHIDFQREINGISYIDINSMAYHWLGSAYENKERFHPKIYESHPSMAFVAPYTDALYTFLEIDHQNGFLRLSGKESTWVSPSPAEQGIPPRMYGSEFTPVISSRSVPFTPQKP
ncbi:MAG: metallophosphoesterase [Bacteroidota bacterium]